MARNSESRVALRSYMPVSSLVKRGDYDALSFKFQAQQEEGLITDRQRALLSWRDYFDQDEDDIDRGKPNNLIRFDGAMLEFGCETPVVGHNTARGVVIPARSSDVMLLHVEDVRGTQHIRQELGKVASYIYAMTTLREKSFILGVTYKEMARLGLRLGMHSLEIDALDTAYSGSVEAEYALSFPQRHAAGRFEPAAVYMDTAEFIDHFSPLFRRTNRQ